MKDEKKYIIPHKHKCELRYNSTTGELEFVCYICGDIVQ